MFYKTPHGPLSFLFVELPERKHSPYQSSCTTTAVEPLPVGRWTDPCWQWCCPSEPGDSHNVLPICGSQHTPVHTPLQPVSRRLIVQWQGTEKLSLAVQTHEYTTLFFLGCTCSYCALYGSHKDNMIQHFSGLSVGFTVNHLASWSICGSQWNKNRYISNILTTVWFWKVKNVAMSNAAVRPLVTHQ